MPTALMQHYLSTWEEMAADGGQFEMTDITVRGVPMRVFKNAPPTMRAFWELTAGYADRDYIVYEDERFTYAEVAASVRSLAHHLRDAHGVGSGDRVAISMRNFPEWVMTYWATVSLGAAVVGMNAWWTSEEMKFGLNDARPKVVIVDDERLERLLSVLDEIRADVALHVMSVRSDRDLPDNCSRWSDVVDASNAPADLPPANMRIVQPRCNPHITAIR